MTIIDEPIEKVSCMYTYKTVTPLDVDLRNVEPKWSPEDNAPG